MARADRPGCPDCAAGHDHCHGTLVAHPGGALECVEAGPCDTLEERHPLVLDCRDLDSPCRCGDRQAVPAPR